MLDPNKAPRHHAQVWRNAVARACAAVQAGEADPGLPRLPLCQPHMRTYGTQATVPPCHHCAAEQTWEFGLTERLLRTCWVDPSYEKLWLPTCLDILGGWVGGSHAYCEVVRGGKWLMLTDCGSMDLADHPQVVGAMGPHAKTVAVECQIPTLARFSGARLKTTVLYLA